MDEEHLFTATPQLSRALCSNPCPDHPGCSVAQQVHHDSLVVLHQAINNLGAGGHFGQDFLSCCHGRTSQTRSISPANCTTMPTATGCARKAGNRSAGASSVMVTVAQLPRPFGSVSYTHLTLPTSALV